MLIKINDHLIASSIISDPLNDTISIINTPMEKGLRIFETALANCLSIVNHRYEFTQNACNFTRHHFTHFAY